MTGLPPSKRPKSSTTAKIDASRALPSLEMMPRELAFAVIDLVPEKVLLLRKTSRMLYSRTTEYALQKTTIPLVEELRFHPKLAVDRLHIIFGLPKSKAPIFELRFKLRRATVNSKTKVRRTGEALTDDRLTLFKFELLEGDYDLWNCVCLSAGKYIERVSFFNCFGEVVQNAITKFLQDFTFKMLEVVNEVLTDEIADHLTETVVTHGIERLKLGLGESVSLSKKRDFLVKLSTFVQSIYISKFDYLNINGAEMLDLIIEMFSNKMSKLHIDSRYYYDWISVRSVHYYQEYFSNEDVDALLENLPLLGKEIWFKSSCNPAAVRPSATVDGHLIEVERMPTKQYQYHFLNIRHTSRTQELPEKETRMIESDPPRRKFF